MTVVTFSCRPSKKTRDFSYRGENILDTPSSIQHIVPPHRAMARGNRTFVGINPMSNGENVMASSFDRLTGNALRIGIAFFTAATLVCERWIPKRQTESTLAT